MYRVEVGNCIATHQRQNSQAVKGGVGKRYLSKQCLTGRAAAIDQASTRAMMSTQINASESCM
eukprot:5005264-Pleurochrysis_carterae.AAC.2